MVLVVVVVAAAVTVVVMVRDTDKVFSSDTPRGKGISAVMAMATAKILMATVRLRLPGCTSSLLHDKARRLDWVALGLGVLHGLLQITVPELL